MKICILTLGCKVNSYESEFIKEEFLKEGFKEVSIGECPDIIVVNTCSVTNQSDAKSRHLIRHVRRECPNSILVVCGCSAQNHQEALKDLEIDILIGNKDKSKIVDYVKKYQKNNQNITKFYNLEKINFEDMLLESKENRTRAFVKIQDGCENFCSYCIIPYLRGNKRSKDINTAYEEIKTLVENGHKEIVLTGIHTGSYGEGLGYDLVDLIRLISPLPNLLRIRISSIEITELTDKFMDELKNNPKLVDHMHIPLQSGSDTVLKYMNRKYDLKTFSSKINTIRSIRPDISITTDLIVGFPHETEKCFEETLDFIKKIKFTKIHTFPFSLRNGTKAEDMKDYFVDEKTKKMRVKQILDLSLKLEHDYYSKFIGSNTEIIVESSLENESKGHTANYILVHVNEPLKEGSVVKVKITSVDGIVVNGRKEIIE